MLSTLTAIAGFIVSQSSLIAVAAITFCLCWWLLKWRRQTSDVRRPPCLPTIPIIGSLPFIPTDMNELFGFFVEKTKRYGNVYGLYFGSSYAIVLNGAEAINDALLKKSSHFAGRAPFYIECNYLNTERKGVVHSAYDASFRQKHQLYLSILKQFGFGQRTMETRINVEVAELVEQGRQTGGKPFDPVTMITFCVMNVITSILLGDRLPYGHQTLVEIKDRIHDWFVGLVYEIDFLPFLRFVPPFRQRMNRMISKHGMLLKLMEREMDRVVAELNTNQNEIKDSFVRRFIEASAETDGDSENRNKNDGFDRKELIYTMRDFFAGGIDTSVTTLRWFLVLMANHPEVLARMQQEIDKVVGKDRLPSLADEPEMTYAQAVVLETMRRHTLVPISLFHETVCDTHVGKYFVPANSTVLVNLYSANMDPTTWNEPTAFRPERFIDEKGIIVGKDKMMSFSRGKRACLGELLARQELFLFMTGIAQNFDILPPEGQQKIDCQETTLFTTEPTPYQCRLIPRCR